jgi:hypothetical protein
MPEETTAHQPQSEQDDLAAFLPSSAILEAREAAVSHLSDRLAARHPALWADVSAFAPAVLDVFNAAYLMQMFAEQSGEPARNRLVRLAKAVARLAEEDVGLPLGRDPSVHDLVQKLANVAVVGRGYQRAITFGPAGLEVCIRTERERKPVLEHSEALAADEAGAAGNPTPDFATGGAA